MKDEADNQHALSNSVGEDARLEDLGYEQGTSLA
jgi:hypothetical protein